MGIAERKERERVQKQNIIIDAAEKVFMSKGFEHATMDDIAEEAEFSKGALYTYFQSKNELCLSIVLRGLKVIVSEFKEITSGTSSGISKIEELKSIFLKFHNEYPNYIFAFSNYKQHRAGCKSDSPILEEIDNENLSIRSMIINILNNGISDKSIKPDIEAEILSFILWGDLSGFISYIPNKMGNFNSVDQYNYTVKLISDAIKNN
jgi:AcrR family transcriptional regulator